jgi:hypothetical protein
MRAWESDPHVLPRTLEVLRFNTCVDDASLECVRLLPRLREIRLGTRNLRRRDVVPHWFHELTSLRRFEVYLASVGDWAGELSAMSLESVSFQVDQMGQDEEDFCYDLGHMFLQDNDNWEDDDSVGRDFFADHVATLPLTRLGESLREIHLDGYNGLTRVPECLLRLPRLQHLDLSGNFDLVELPESLGQLPLVVLDLRWTAIETLPASLRTTATLRILELVDTRLSADVDDAIRVKRGRVRVRRRGYDRAFAPGQRGTPGDADDIRRRDKILRPLSLAIPDLRIHMHSDEDGGDFERTASMHWWHARCGYDWWDFVFFAPPPEDYIF